MRRDLQSMHDQNACRVVLREVIRAGLIDWTFGEAAHESIITPNVINYVERKFAKSKNSADSQSAGDSPKSIHFRESSRGLVVHPETSPQYSEWHVEVARFYAPRGAVGVVKGFEQYLAQQSDGEAPAFVYTQNSRWGIPGPWHTGLTNEITNPGTWHFRLHNLSRFTPPWYDLIGAGALPDLPYTDFPHETDLWFPAGSAASQNVHLLVPAGYMLRLFFTTPSQSVRLEVAAKLKGYIQSDRTPETAHNVRTNY